MSDLVYYVATSLDGYIAAPDGDFSAFPVQPDTLADLFARYPETCPVMAREALGVTAAPRRFGTVLMGYRTYEPALQAGLPGGVYPHLRQVVATHRDLAEVETVQGDLPGAVARLRDETEGDIWLCGGGELAAQLVDEIDEIQLKVNPVLLGRGIPVLPAGDVPRTFALVSAERLPGDVLLATYRRR